MIEISDNRYIGVFDSGLGGLTTVKELMHRLPNEGIVYFGDTGRVPYGTKSQETIIKFVRSDINFLLEFNIKLVIAACGTASAIALPLLRSGYDVPMIGVTEPAAEQAVRATKNKRVGIIGTQATIESDTYHQLIAAHDPDIFTISRACPLFVPLVENGYLKNEVARLVAEDYLPPLRDAGVDTLIMGCTHYPLLSETIGKSMGKGVTLIDPGRQTAVSAEALLAERNILSDRKPAENQYRFFVSDSVAGFSKLGSLFLEREITEQVQKVDIEKY